VGRSAPATSGRAAVGKAQIKVGQVQVRVRGTCSDSAIGSISSSGSVTCTSAPPAEFGVGSAATPIGTTSTTVVSKSLPGGSALAIVNAYVALPASAQRTQVSCTLSVSGTSLSATSVIAAGRLPEGSRSSPWEDELPSPVPQRSWSVACSLIPCCSAS
jgi:hypothetical protein